MYNNISVQQRATSKISFHGSLHKSAQKIFTDLCHDVPTMKTYKGDVLRADDVYKKLSDYVAKTNKDTELYWRVPSLRQILFKNDSYEGFMFWNKLTEKEIRGSKYPDNVFADYVSHPTDKYIDELGVTAQGPSIEPRERIVKYRSTFIEKLYEYSHDYSYYITRDGYTDSFQNAPMLGAITGLIRKIIGIFPQKKVHPYNECTLFEINRWVEQLTTHTEPKDVDKLLNIVK